MKTKYKVKIMENSISEHKSDCYLKSEIETNLILNDLENIDNKDQKFISRFSKQGKQGVAGITEIEKHKCVYKVSQNINYIIRHEYQIMQALNEISEYCPHFCKVYNIKLCDVDGDYRKKDNPFEVKSKHPIKSEFMFMEYIDSMQFYYFIKNQKFSNELLFSTIKQLLMAIYISQTKKQFTHYDLHSCNVMMRQCNKDDVFLYILDDENQLCVPTNGYYPVIIDFGFSYIENMDNNPLWASLAHTEVGFMTNQYDPIADPKLLLVTMSDELKRYRNSHDITKFRNIVRNIFNPLDIDWESGWDVYNSELGAANYICEYIEKIKIKSKIFDRYNYICIDLIQSLIKLPLSPQTSNNMDISYKMLVSEFTKIENEVNNSLHSIYILKCIIDVARQIKKKYSNKETQQETVTYFRRCVQNIINKLVPFCKPKKVDYEKLLCSLYVFSQNCEGLLYKLINAKTQDKKNTYNELELQTIEQMFAAFEINIKSEYKFNKNSKVYIFDCDNEDRKVIKDIPQFVIDLLNMTHPLMRGCVLNDYMKGDFDENIKKFD